MINFRRWLKLGSPTQFVLGIAIVGSSSGCRNLSQYFADAAAVSPYGATADWQGAEPLPAPYELPPTSEGVPGSLSPSSPVLPPPAAAAATTGLTAPPPIEAAETDPLVADTDETARLKTAPVPDPDAVLPTKSGMPLSSPFPMSDEPLESVTVSTPDSSGPQEPPLPTDPVLPKSDVPESALPAGADVASPADEPFGSDLFPEDGPLTTPKAAASVNVPFEGLSEVAVPEPAAQLGDAPKAPSLPAELEAQPESGQPESGQPESGQPEPGQPETAAPLKQDGSAQSQIEDSVPDERGFVKIEPEVVAPPKRAIALPMPGSGFGPVIKVRPAGFGPSIKVAPAASVTAPTPESKSELKPESASAGTGAGDSIPGDVASAVENAGRGGAIGQSEVAVKPEVIATPGRELASITKPGSLPSGLNARPEPIKPVTIPAASTAETVATVGQVADAVEFDADGNAFVSHEDSISRVMPDGQVELWTMNGALRGHAILPNGSHAVCDAQSRSVLQLSSRGEAIGTFAHLSDGDFLRAPNDLVMDSSGGLYFTDPGYARIQNPIGKVHYVASNGAVNVVAQRLAYPEGIAISPDGATLYVVESQTRSVLAFAILSAGRVGPKRVLCRLPESAADSVLANGMTIDSRGRLFVAGGTSGQVHVISVDGELLKSIETGLSDVTNVRFADSNSSRLFVTGSADNATGVLARIDVSGL